MSTVPVYLMLCVETAIMMVVALLWPYSFLNFTHPFLPYGNVLYVFKLFQMSCHICFVPCVTYGEARSVQCKVK